MRAARAATAARRNSQSSPPTVEVRRAAGSERGSDSGSDRGSVAPSPGPVTSREQLRELFDEIDADGGGTLDKQEIKQLADKLGVAMTRRELDQAMAEMDADGSGEVDFDEFAEWWPKQEGKNSALMSALNDRWGAALKRVQERKRAEQEQSETEKALKAVAKSHGTMMRQVNAAEERSKQLATAIAQIKQELRESQAETARERVIIKEQAEDYEMQIKALVEKIEEQQRVIARGASALQTEQARREQDVRTLSLAHEDLQGKIERKDIRIDALVGQVAGLEWQIKQLRMENANERERTVQVQADMERIREKVNREKQADVARREDQITRLLATLERHKSKEQVLLEELKQMTEKKDAYKRELKDMRALVKHATEAGRAAKAAADKGTMFTIIS
jgi:septal ring factor EnvC (AmiA/AmiB activator)